jgi:hypothetical protein
MPADREPRRKTEASRDPTPKPLGAKSPGNLELLRRKESILLSRARVVRELSSAQNPRYKAVLTKALADLDAQLCSFPDDAPAPSEVTAVSYDFGVVFSRDLTPAQVGETLVALADFYRACGGVGLQVELGLEEVDVTEPICV